MPCDMLHLGLQIVFFIYLRDRHAALCISVYCTILLTNSKKLQRENNDKNTSVIIFIKIKREIKKLRKIGSQQRRHGDSSLWCCYLDRVKFCYYFRHEQIISLNLCKYTVSQKKLCKIVLIITLSNFHQF